MHGVRGYLTPFVKRSRLKGGPYRSSSEQFICLVARERTRETPPPKAVGWVASVFLQLTLLLIDRNRIPPARPCRFSNRAFRMPQPKDLNSYGIELSLADSRSLCVRKKWLVGRNRGPSRRVRKTQRSAWRRPSKGDRTIHLSDPASLVLGRPLDMIDHQHVHGPLGRHQFQAELFLDGLKYTGSVWRANGSGRARISREWSRRSGIVGRKLERGSRSNS